jgi:hypothetical protein
MKIQGTEMLLLDYTIKDEDAAAALDYVNTHHENWTMEGHLTRYGNLDRLDPVNYHPYFTLQTPQGRVPDTEKRSFHYATWITSPRTYMYHNLAILRNPSNAR